MFVVGLLACLVGWSVGCLDGWLAIWMAGLVGWFDGLFVGWSPIVYLSQLSNNTSIRSMKVATYMQGEWNSSRER